MTSSNTALRGKLMRRFAALGPYLREDKCENGLFFFDCLVVCTDVEKAPEKRAFLGWWMELKLENDLFSYIYQFGISDREGCWQKKAINQPEVQKKVEAALRKFHKLLHDSFIAMELKLAPARQFNEQSIKLLCHL